MQARAATPCSPAYRPEGRESAGGDKFGVVGGGRFTPLPRLVIPNGSVDNTGGIAC
jgi:hypothetical protein